MKILQICPGAYVSGRGGVSEHVRRISEGLVRRGHDVTVFATNSGRLLWFERINGVKVKRFSRFAPSTAYFFSPGMLWALIRVNEFDVIHAHNFHAFPMHFARFAKCKRFVVTTHFHGAGHSIFRSCLFRLFENFGKQTLLKANVVVAVSEYEKNLLLDRFKLDESKVVVVPNGLDLKEFEGIQRQNKDYKNLLFVGRLEAYKGVQYLIEVLPKLPTEVILNIVGRGSLRELLERRAKELGVYNRVRFYQDLSRSDLLQFFVDADIFVLLSKYEAYSLVVAEALAAGTPCILLDTAALSEWIDGKYCFGINFPIDLDKLRLLIDKVLNLEFKKTGITKWKKKIIDWDDVVARLEYFYFG